MYRCCSRLYYGCCKTFGDFNEMVFAKYLRSWCRKYPNRGYGLSFSRWLATDNYVPYNSYGNGSAMRVSPCALFFSVLDSVLEVAQYSAQCTHNHAEGIKGAKAVADCIFVCKNKIVPKNRLLQYVSEKYGYKLNFTCDDIRKSNTFDETCQVTVPQAIVSFVESSDFEDTIRLAVSIGGDSDTIAAIAGSIAEAYYGVPDNLWNEAKKYLTPEIMNVVDKFYGTYIGCEQRPFLEEIK